MATTIDFYKLNSDADGPFFVASLVIDAQGETSIRGNENIRRNLRDEFKEGLPSFHEEKQLFPSDGKEYIQRLLARYSGSRFWAREREEGDDPGEFCEASAGPEQ